MLFLLLGCIPVPYISPPMDMSVQLDPRPVVNVGGGESRWPTALDFRLGAAPLAVFPALQDRLIDPTAGFVYSWEDPAGNGETRLGGYGRVAWRAWRRGGTHRFTLLEPRVTGDLTVAERGGGLGGGGSIGLAFRAGGNTGDEETTVFTGSPDGIGVAYGEFGVALALDIGMVATPAGVEERVMLALEFRAPASAGVVLVPIPLSR